MSIRTYNIKLLLTEEQYAFWYNTLCEVRRAYNGCSKYIKDNNIKVSLTSVHNSCYNWMRDTYCLNAQPIIETYKDVIASYRTIKANKKHSYPQRRQLCLQLDKHLYSKLSVDGIGLSGRIKGKKDYVTFKRFKQMEHLFEIGKPHDPRIFYRGNSFYLSIPFKVEDKPMVDSSIPLGVDLGIKRLFVTSDGNYYKDKRFNCRKRTLRYLKRKLNSVGTKSVKRHLKQLKRKERNINKEHINLATNALISSVNPNVGVIVLEDLKQIKQRTSKFKGTNVKRTSHNNMLGQVPFYEFKRVLEYKAQHVGLRVETVSPTFTSKTDSVTNNRDGNRCGCRYYSTKGIVFDADWNASINIAKRYNSKHPYSFPLPIDGGMKGNLKGRLLVNKPIVSCKSNY